MCFDQLSARLEGINEEAVQQMHLHEERAWQAVIHLWEVFVSFPTIEMKLGKRHQLSFERQ
jgi:hypothetical protein